MGRNRKRSIYRFLAISAYFSSGIDVDWIITQINSVECSYYFFVLTRSMMNRNSKYDTHPFVCMYVVTLMEESIILEFLLETENQFCSWHNNAVERHFFFILFPLACLTIYRTWILLMQNMFLCLSFVRGLTTSCVMRGPLGLDLDSLKKYVLEEIWQNLTEKKIGL